MGGSTSAQNGFPELDDVEPYVFATRGSNPGGKASSTSTQVATRDQASRENRRPRARARQRPPVTGNNIPDMILVPHWDDDNGGVWDRITIAGIEFSGTCRVEGDGPKLDVQRRKRPGANGARIVTRGYKPAEFKVVLRVWTQEHLSDFSQLAVQLHQARAGLRPKSFELYHPALQLASITTAVISGIPLLKPTGTQGLFEAELDCIEDRDPGSENVTQRPSRQRGLTSAIGTLEIDERFRTANDNPNAVTSPGNDPDAAAP
jgi:hypothetical protein